METQYNEVFVHKAVESGELEIDGEGRVWRVMKRVPNRWMGMVNLKPCKRVRAESSNGRYLQVKVMRSGLRRYAAAHRLVWFHFRGPIPPGLTINHKNGNGVDNHLENLEVATSQEQREHAAIVLGFRAKGPSGEANTNTHLRMTDIPTIRMRASRGDSLQLIAGDYGLTRDAIYRIVSRRSWRHIP